MLTWVLPSALVAFLWAAADIFSKMILNMGIDFKVFFVLGSFAYFIVGLIYFIIDKKTRDKFIKLTFDLNNFIPSESIAKDCLRRIEIEYVNTNIENLRLDIKNNPEDISLIKVLSDFEKEISNIKAKYNE